MITVFLGDYHYKYNGKFGVITDMITGNAVILSEAETNACNLRDLNIKIAIAKYF